MESNNPEEPDMIRKVLIAISIAAAIYSPAQAADTLNFGIISTDSSSNLKKIWVPLLKDMEKQTGYKVKPFFASDYAGVIEGMRFKKVDIAWFGNKSAMEAVDRAGGEVFAQNIGAGGAPGYWSHIIVHKDSPAKKLDDVLKCDKSLNFGIGDPNSTSGFLVPTTFIFAARNIEPVKCFKTVRGANHAANALAVANKLVDAATNNNESLARLKVNNPKAYEKIRVIWKSPLIPSDPLVWRKDLASGVKAKISAFLYGYGKTPEEKKVLAGLKLDKFTKSSNNQLLPIRQMSVNKEIMKIKADKKLSDADRAAKLDALQKKAVAIAKLLASVTN